MPLTDKTLAELAQLNAAIGPSYTQQGGAAISATNGAPGAVSDGVDVAEAIWAHVRLKLTDAATDGQVRIWGLPEGGVLGDWGRMAGFELVDFTGSWQEMIPCAVLDRIYVEAVALGGEDLDVQTGPCLGGAA